MFSQIITTLGFIMCQVILKSLTVESGFHKTPTNTVAVVGEVMKMTCWTNPNETTQWSFSQDGERTFLLVYNGKTVSPSFIPRFNVDNSAGIGHHDLTAKDVNMTDAGIYECVVLSKDTQGRTTPVSATAELIVLESDPVCNTNISTKDGSIKEFDYVVFRCAVNFSGQFTPSMHWSEVENTLNETSVVINSNMSVGMQHFSSVTILKVNGEMNGILVTCKAQFSETPTKVHYTNATNIPDYLFRWNTTLNVHFGASNVTITPRKDRYRQDDVLNCSAVGNPSPSYTWINLETNETIAAGPQLALSKIGIDANQRYTIECVAQNHVAGELKLSSATVDVIIQGTGILYITISIGTVCAVLLLVVIVIVREHIKGLIADLTSLFRGGPANEPDVLPNADEIQNGADQADNYELEPYGHYAMAAEAVALGAVAIDPEQSVKPVPVYAEINKPHKYRKNESASSSPPLTLNVGSKHNRNEYATYEFREDCPAVTTMNPSSSKLNIGLDGTVYAKLKTDGGHHQSEASGSLFQDPMFNKSEYASIDHTTKPPPPPQKD